MRLCTTLSRSDERRPPGYEAGRTESNKQTQTWIYEQTDTLRWLGSWVVSVLDSRTVWVQIAAVTLSGNSLMQTVHTHCASVHPTAKLVVVLLRVVRVTAGLVESNGSLPPGLRITSPTAGGLPRTGISSGTIHSAIKYMGYLYLLDTKTQLYVHTDRDTQTQTLTQCFI